MNTNDLSTEINNAVASLGGIDSAISACDNMYSATFRSEPFRLDLVDNWEAHVKDIQTELAMVIYAEETGNEKPIKPDTDTDFELDCYYLAIESYKQEALDWLDESYPENTVNGHSLVVNFCNYKGEGEDEIGLYTIHIGLPVFTNKNDSFFSANNL